MSDDTSNNSNDGGDGDNTEKASSSSPSSALYESRVDENGKNKIKVYCTRCPSLILTPPNGTYVKEKFSLPSDKVKTKDPKLDEEEEKGGGAASEEVLHDCWRIANMYLFENIGFSNTVGTIKYLVCADCESGPIGWHDLSSKASYLSWNRIRHSEDN